MKINIVILLLLLAILVSLPVHEFIHLVFMKVFSKGNAKIEFAKDPLGLPSLRAVFYGKVTKVLLGSIKMGDNNCKIRIMK